MQPFEQILVTILPVLHLLAWNFLITLVHIIGQVLHLMIIEVYSFLGDKLEMEDDLSAREG